MIKSTQKINLIEEVKKEVIKPKTSISFRKMFEEALDKYDEKYPHKHRKIDGYLSISQISGESCMRKNYYDIMGYQKQGIPFRNRIIMDFGTRLHELAQQCMGEFGYLKGVEDFMFLDELKVCGSTDGWLVNQDNGSLILNDIKTANLNTYQKVLSTNEPKKDHKAQVHWYSYILRKKANIEINDLKITYICKNQSSYTPLWQQDFDKLNNFVQILNNDPQYVYSDELKSLNYINYKLQKDFQLSQEDDYLIKEVDFKYDEEIIKKEIEKIEDFWALIENNKELVKNGKKEKIPSKIRDGVICQSCNFRKVCRNYD